MALAFSDRQGLRFKNAAESIIEVPKMLWRWDSMALALQNLGNYLVDDYLSKKVQSSRLTFPDPATSKSRAASPGLDHKCLCSE
jgi:hypothetical protein